MFLLFLNLVAFAGGECKTKYTPLKDQQWTICNVDVINAFYQNNLIELSYQYMITDVSSSFLEAKVQASTELVFKFAEMQKLDSYECLPKLSLDIHQVSMEVLNDRKRFPFYQNMGQLNIWGLYDPTVKNYGAANKSAIMFTNHEPKDAELTIAHELAHYWFDRFCWNRTWKGTPETFAIEFEEFYLKQGD